MSSRPLRVFISYSQKDAAFRETLESHLAPLQRQRIIESWHDRHIPPGSETAQVIDDNLAQADIILFLVSADFLASDSCYDVEVRQAMERQARGLAVVVPLLIRPVDWREAPFAHLTALPKGGRPISEWPNPDQAWVSVAESIRTLARGLPLGAGDAGRPSWRRSAGRALAVVGLLGALLAGSILALRPRGAQPGTPPKPAAPVTAAPPAEPGCLVRPFSLGPRQTDFIGRERELTLAEKALESRRPVAFYGMGGTGKTELARELSYRLDQRGMIPDGAVLIQSDGRRADSIYTELAAALCRPDIAEERPEPRRQHLAALLNRRRVVIIIDGVPDTEPGLFEELSRTLGGGMVIFTSRVSPPAGAGLVELQVGDLSPEWALSLLRRRLHLPTGHAQALAEIVRRVTGNPKALMLASATALHFRRTPEEYAAELAQHGIAVIGTGPERMDLYFDTTLAGLGPQRECFEALGALPGLGNPSFTAEALQQVCLRPDTAEALRQMVTLSLLEADEGQRYHVHALLQDFARRRLLRAGQLEEKTARWIRYYVSTVGGPTAPRTRRLLSALAVTSEISSGLDPTGRSAGVLPLWSGTAAERPPPRAVAPDKLLRSLRFTGNLHLTEAQLRDAIGTTERQPYEEEGLELDILLLTALYYDYGFIDAKVGPPQLVRDARGIALTIPIAEGAVYSLGKIDFSGELLWSKEEHARRQGITQGERFNRSKVGTSVIRLSSAYTNLGYAFVNVTPKTSVDADERTVNITFEINKGPKVHIESIRIQGNRAVREELIRRELGISPGDMFDGAKLDQGVERIRGLGLFANVEQLVRRGSREGLGELEIRVTEPEEPEEKKESREVPLHPDDVRQALGALEQAVARKDRPAAVQLALGLLDWLVSRGYWDDALRAARVGRSVVGSTDAQERWVFDLYQAQLLTSRGAYQEAEQALADAARAADGLVRATALFLQANARHLRGDPAAAAALYRQSQELLRPLLIARGEGALLRIESAEQALRLLPEALRQPGATPAGRTSILLTLISVELAVGKAALAQHHLEQVMILAQRERNPLLVAWAIIQLGVVECTYGGLPQAAEELDLGLELATRLHHPALMGKALYFRARVDHADPNTLDTKAADRRLRQALQLFSELHDQNHSTEAREELARLELRSQLGARTGVFLPCIDPKSALGRSGVRTDDLLMEYNGAPVKERLDRLVATPGQGPTATLVLRRLIDNQPQSVTVALPVAELRKVFPLREVLPSLGQRPGDIARELLRSFRQPSLSPL